MDEYKSAQQVLQAIRELSPKQSGEGLQTSDSSRYAKSFRKPQRDEKTRPWEREGSGS